MGVVDSIDHDSFPEQGKIGKGVRVCFKYDTSKTIGGVIVRDDMAKPYRTIIRLNDGRIVLATECQFAFDDKYDEDLDDVFAPVSSSDYAHWDTMTDEQKDEAIKKAI